MSIINLIFDMDGCLINSSEVQKASYFGSYKEIVGDNNCPPFSEYMKYTGDSLPNIFTKMGLPVEMAESYRKISRKAIDKIIVNKEVIELIKEYRDKGSKVAICTGKDHLRAQEILDYYNISHLFDALVSSDDVINPKPAPDSIVKALELMNVNRKNTIVIGDGYSDIISAKEAGLVSVLTFWYGDEGVPRKADYYANTVADLKLILKGL